MSCSATCSSTRFNSSFALAATATATIISPLAANGYGVLSSVADRRTGGSKNGDMMGDGAGEILHLSRRNLRAAITACVTLLRLFFGRLEGIDIGGGAGGAAANSGSRWKMTTLLASVLPGPTDQFSCPNISWHRAFSWRLKSSSGWEDMLRGGSAVKFVQGAASPHQGALGNFLPLGNRSDRFKQISDASPQSSTQRA